MSQITKKIIHGDKDGNRGRGAKEKQDRSAGNRVGAMGSAATTDCSSTTQKVQNNIKNEDPLIGKSLAGRYLIEKRIGQGGMGVVYQAKHEALNRPVAIKTIRNEIQSSEETLLRFEREARAAASLDSEYVVDVIDYGHTDDGMTFMVMELLQGCSLEQLLDKEGYLQSGRAVFIARQIAKGLAVAHEAGLIHRDLKSANVFLVEREGGTQVKLLDFGISKFVKETEQDVKLTTTGAVIGTPNYMSPEQAMGRIDLDHRVDIYSLGVIVYEMLSGTFPFHGNNVLDVTYKHINAEPQEPSRACPEADISAELDAIVLCCLEKNPADRFQSAAAFIDALPEASSLPAGPGSGQHASQLPVAHQTETNPGFRHQWLVATLLAGILIGVIIAIGYLGTSDKSGENGSTESGVSNISSDFAKRAEGEFSGNNKSKTLISQSIEKRKNAMDPSSQQSKISLTKTSENGSLKSAHVIRIVPHPSFSRVYSGERLIGRGEQVLSIDGKGGPVEISVEAEGYVSQRYLIDPDNRNEQIDIRLEPHPLDKRGRTGNSARSKSPITGQTKTNKKRHDELKEKRQGRAAGELWSDPYKTE